jgi:hypothetical protein
MLHIVREFWRLIRGKRTGLLRTACAAFSDVKFGVTFMLYPTGLCLLFPICEQFRSDKRGRFCSVQVFYACTFVIN